MISLEASNVICYDLHTIAITCLSSGCRSKHSEFKNKFNNFFVIWDKVALDKSDIVYRLTQNTRNTGHGVFGKSCSETAERLQNLNILVIQKQHTTI